LSGTGANEDGPRRHTRFHGRVEGTRHVCSFPGCEEAGEFRAPPEERRGAPDGPPAWRWFCLEHIRTFNQQYNYFKYMSAEEIHEAQRPYAGWERETRAFSANAASGTPPPRWADFADPLDAIGARFKARMAEAAQRQDGKPLSGEDRSALRTLGLATDADRKALRTRYTELVRKFHPDHNGGDRAHEKALQEVIAAYAHLRKAPAFA
jgi:hypothetical protein